MKSQCRPPRQDHTNNSLLHSQAGMYPWLLVDIHPSFAKATVAIKPEGPPFQEQVARSTFDRPYRLTGIPLTYDQPATNLSPSLQIQLVSSKSSNRSSCTLQKERTRQPVNLIKVPVLLETSEASYHSLYDQCTVELLKQDAHLGLANIEIRRNEHLPFLREEH